jgi:hypothetical protein
MIALRSYAETAKRRFGSKGGNAPGEQNGRSSFESGRRRSVAQTQVDVGGAGPLPALTPAFGALPLSYRGKQFSITGDHSLGSYCPKTPPPLHAALEER